MLISVLIPAYNNKCYTLVAELQKQLEASGVVYEILVAEDGSRDQVSIISNHRISELPHCRHIIRRENIGRAAIRNFLAREAKGEWVLFVDSGISILNDNFITSYLKVLHTSKPCVINGGVIAEDARGIYTANLRYRYEKAEEPNHSAIVRSQRPHNSFRSTNFLAHHTVMKSFPFDENYKKYGYEDIAFGINLQRHNVMVFHIDNPVVYTEFESNKEFLAKTEESLDTLQTFSDQIRGYSMLIAIKDKLRRYKVLSLARLAHRIICRIERHNLLSTHPSLFVFKLYKLGYFISLS